MKQILFLLLFPAYAMAQYPANAGQKITLGEQTTADGLVWRGRSADTANLLTNKLDTSVYIVLDTGTRAMWYYRASTTPKWTRLVDSLNNLQGQLSLTTKVTGVLPLGNGGTGSATQNFVDLTNTQIIGGMKTFTDRWQGVEIGISRNGSNNVAVGPWLRWTNTEIGTANKQVLTQLNASNGITTWTFDGNNWISRYTLTEFGEVGIGTTTPSQKLHVVGNARISAMNGIGDIGADANGVLQAATSDMNLKNTIENSQFGLNEILLLNPVTFLYNDENRKIDSDVKEVGFIAQDVFDIIPNAVSSTGTGDLQLDYRAITATLVKAIQEQNALIKALEQRILIFENK